MTGVPGSPTLRPPCESPRPNRRAWQMWTWSSRASLIADGPAGTWGPSGLSASTRRTRCVEGTPYPDTRATISYLHTHLSTDRVVLRTNFQGSFPVLQHVLFIPAVCLQAEWPVSSLSPQLYLGMYPDEHFTEKPVKAAMENFRKQLAEITSSIKRRNDGKKLPYYNMSPDKIPNSVAVWGKNHFFGVYYHAPTEYFANSKLLSSYSNTLSVWFWYFCIFKSICADKKANLQMSTLLFLSLIQVKIG